MRVVSYCSKCLRGTPLSIPGEPEVFCRHCSDKRSVTPSASITENKIVDVCALCGGGHFYIEKQFPGWLGGSIVVAAIVSFLILTTVNIAVALGVLLGAAALDWVVYQVVPLRTICYQCLAAYCGAARNPEHTTYELGTAGRFADDYEKQRHEHSGKSDGPGV